VRRYNTAAHGMRAGRTDSVQQVVPTTYDGYMQTPPKPPGAPPTPPKPPTPPELMAAMAGAYTRPLFGST